jgi:hypothetical protein
MDRPGNTKGLPVIRTRFGEMSAQFGVNFDLTVEAMMEDEAWRAEVKAERSATCRGSWTSFSRKT